MRRRGARQDPRPLRPLGRPRGAAPRVRRLARRQQGQQRPACRAQVRPRRQGLQVRGDREALHAALPGHPVLELQPLRGAGGVRQGQGLPERSRAGAARDLDGRTGRLLFGRRPDVRQGRRVQEGRPGPEHAAGAAPAPGRLRGRAPLRDDLRPAAGHPGPGHPDLHPHLHRRLSGLEAGVDRPAAALVHGRDHRHPGGADLAPALLPAAARDQAGARHVEPVLQPHPAAARRLLRPALRRRDRLARPDQRRRRQDHRRPAGDDDHRQRPDDLLRDADVPLRRQADDGGAAAVGLQHRRGQGRQPRPHRRQPAPQAGPRQAAGHGDERSQDDRDPQGDGFRGRVLRPLGRLLRQVDQHHAAARRARPDRRRGAAVRADRDDRRGAGPRRPQGHAGRLHRRHAGRLPDAARQLHATARQLRELQLVAAGAPGRHEPPGRRAALPGRRPVPRPGGADDRQGGRAAAAPARTASQPERRRSSVRPGPG